MYTNEQARPRVSYTAVKSLSVGVKYLPRTRHPSNSQSVGRQQESIEER